MSSFRSRPEETDGQHAQFWNLAGINQSFLSLDRRSLLSVEEFDHDVDQSVVSSNGWDTNNNPAFVSPPTSTYSNSNLGDYTNTTCNQFYTTDAAYKWGCDQAIGADYIGGDGQCSLTIDPRPERLEDVFADDYTYPGPGPSIPSIDQTSYLDPSFLGVGDGMDMGNIGPDLEGTHLEPPKITVEDTGDTGGMEPWLYGMYTPGLGIINNKIPPQAGPSSASAGTLGVTHRHREPADDQVTESSVNTSHTSHSCRTCSKNFGNKDDLRRHQRYHDTKKHTCRTCGKGFVHPKDLRRHKTTHSTVRPGRACPVDGCATATGRKDNLKRHVQNKHPDFDFDAWVAAC